jgi:hypothetical protein
MGPKVASPKGKFCQPCQPALGEPCQPKPPAKPPLPAPQLPQLTGKLPMVTGGHFGKNPLMHLILAHYAQRYLHRKSQMISTAQSYHNTFSGLCIFLEECTMKIFLKCRKAVFGRPVGANESRGASISSRHIHADVASCFLHEAEAIVGALLDSHRAAPKHLAAGDSRRPFLSASAEGRGAADADPQNNQPDSGSEVSPSFFSSRQSAGATATPKFKCRRGW